MRLLSFTFIFLFLANFAHAGVLNDAWGDIIRQYPNPQPRKEERVTLASIFNPVVSNYPDHLLQKKNITIEDIKGKSGMFVKRHPASLSKPFSQKKLIKPYKKTISKAMKLFNVPANIIGGVIIQESGGKRFAKAKTSSAKGLMQTIDSTFKLAQKNLYDYGIFIKNPYNASDSIMAGTWYLSWCFEAAREDFPSYNDRSNTNHWKKGLEYYYAGPTWGKNHKPLFFVEYKGKKIIIKKGHYSNKVLEFANSL